MKFRKKLFTTSIVVFFFTSVAAANKPERLDFVSQQLASQKLNELKAISTKEMVDTQAKYYRDLYLALIQSGFSQEEALKIVIAKASEK